MNVDCSSVMQVLLSSVNGVFRQRNGTAGPTVGRWLSVFDLTFLLWRTRTVMTSPQPSDTVYVLSLSVIEELNAFHLAWRNFFFFRVSLLCIRYLTQYVGAMLWSMAQLRRGQLRVGVCVLDSC